MSTETGATWGPENDLANNLVYRCNDAQELAEHFKQEASELDLGPEPSVDTKRCHAAVIAGLGALADMARRSGEKAEELARELARMRRGDDDEPQP